ncbi:MAG: type VI secretion system baseplate subunit TssK [Bdellovibrionota bacterium]
MSTAQIAWNQIESLSLNYMYFFEQYMDRMIKNSFSAQNSLMWGFENLTLDISGLNEGRLGIISCAGIMPDGTFFVAPQEAPLPQSITVTPDLFGDNKELTIYLALLSKSSSNSPKAHYHSGRFVFDKVNIENENIPVSRPHFTLIAGKQKLENYSYLAVANIIEVRSDGSIILDTNFIHPTFSLQNNPKLMTKMKDLHSNVKQKTKILSNLCTASAHTGSQLSASHMDASMLEIYNHFDVYLQRVLKSTAIHPQDVYYQLTEFYAKLATYLDATKMAKDIKTYNHYNIADSYDDISEELKTQFRTALDRPATQSVLKQGFLNAYYTQDLKPRVVPYLYFVLIVSADMPSENIKKYFPGQCKVSAASHIDHHFKSMSTGVKLMPLSVIPQHVPYFHDSVYFQLPQIEEYEEAWQAIDEEGQIAFHVTGDYPELKMQLWLIKKESMKL